jgi:hypothetical protein
MGQVEPSLPDTFPGRCSNTVNPGEGGKLSMRPGADHSAACVGLSLVK